MLAATRKGLEHLALALQEAVDGHHLTMGSVENFSALAGFGVQGHVQGSQLRIGNLRFMEQHGVDCSRAVRVPRNGRGR